MIKTIHVADVASYSSEGETLSDLKQVNFIYGSNATGKTTISRVINDPESHPDCEVEWQSDLTLNTMVYNRDFVEDNFNSPDELKVKGIFTLGKKDKEILDKIKEAKDEVSKLTSTIANLNVELEGDDVREGKIKNLEMLNTNFEVICWDLKKKHDEKLGGAFERLRNSKTRFKEKLLEESSRNISASTSLLDLEKKAETVFVKTSQIEQLFDAPDSGDLLKHESAPILEKKIIGKSDVDIAGMIEKIGNSDWVRRGRDFYNPTELICPFCQQSTKPNLESSLNKYFDEVFDKDSFAIEELSTNYKSDSLQILQAMQELLDSSSKWLDLESLQTHFGVLESKVRANIQKIEQKLLEPSKVVSLDSLKSTLETLLTLISKANTSIQKHNEMVSDRKNQSEELTGQVWRYLLDQEIASDLITFTDSRTKLKTTIADLR